jgi:hypothetical protein
VLVPSYYNHCSANECDVDIPLGALSGGGLDFASLQAVVLFVDSSIASGFYAPVISRVVFRSNSDPIDTQTDPENCGAIGKSCFAGACRSGVCQAGTVVGDLACASTMAAQGGYIFVGDRESISGGPQNIYRYGLSGEGRTLWVQDTGYVSSMVRDGNQLFYAASPNGLGRFTDGAGAPEILFGGSVSQLQLAGENVVALDNPNTDVIIGNKSAAPGGFSTLTDLGGDYPMYSASTESHVYYATGSAEGSAIVGVDLATGARTTVDTPNGIFGLWTHGGAVYYSYRLQSGVGGIRRGGVGVSRSEVVPQSAPTESHGNPFVDESGIYHSFYDGTQNRFYRTAHGNPNDRVLVTTGLSPYQGPVAFTADSILWMNVCSRGGPGNVQRLAKP